MEKDSYNQPVQYHTNRCKIPDFFQIRQDILPKDFEQYLDCYKNRCQGQRSFRDVRRILSGLNIYLQQSNIDLHKISIEQIDSFQAYYNKNLAQSTSKLYRAYLRGFLKYLYQEGCIRKDLASLVVGPPEFARSTPPKFLRPKEVQKLFNSLDLSANRDIRTYAMIHLAYYIGLRPKEISLITFDDISYSKRHVNASRQNEITVSRDSSSSKTGGTISYCVWLR